MSQYLQLIISHVRLPGISAHRNTLMCHNKGIELPEDKTINKLVLRVPSSKSNLSVPTHIRRLYQSSTHSYLQNVKGCIGLRVYLSLITLSMACSDGALLRNPILQQGSAGGLKTGFESQL